VIISSVAAASADPNDILPLFAIGLLIGLLAIREIVTHVPRKWAQDLRHALLIGLVPLLLTFSFILVARIIQILK